MKAYAAGIKCIQYFGESKEERLKYCDDYYDVINQNILHFLKDKPNKLTVHLENFEQDFAVFWHGIGAQGDLDKALKTFSQKSNQSLAQNKMKNLRKLFDVFWKEVKYLWRE
jgi:hypothetical protein